MTPQKFRKKPIVIEALQYDGNNTGAILDFCQGAAMFTAIDGLRIVTLEGLHHVSKNDWVIKGIANEYYPCKADIFERTYEKV
jgi:hypothetical protein